jgi:hypothetical protein
VLDKSPSDEARKEINKPENRQNMQKKVRVNRYVNKFVVIEGIDQNVENLLK